MAQGPSTGELVFREAAAPLLCCGLGFQMWKHIPTLVLGPFLEGQKPGA